MTRLARLRDVFVPEVDPDRAYFCTYGFDARFFEAELLPALLPNSLSLDREAGSESAYLNAADTALQRRDVGVFFDHLDRAGDGPEILNAAWRVDVPRRAFHAKLMLLDYGTYVRAVIGSANLTPAAWTRNLELFVVEDLVRGVPHEWAGGLKSFVAQLIGRIPSAQSTHRTALAGVLDGIPSAPNGQDRVTSTWDEPLLDALFEGIAAPERIDIVTPFFEGATGDGVFDAIRARAPRISGRLFVSTSTDHGRVQVLGPADKLEALLAEGGWTLHGVRTVWDGDEAGAPERGLHGKALILEHSDGSRTMVGSANVTRAALLGQAPGQSNVEIVVLRNGTSKQAQGVLPQADELKRSEVDFLEQQDVEDEDVLTGPERYVTAATYHGQDGSLELAIEADAPRLVVTYETRMLFSVDGPIMRAPLTLGLARYVVVDNGTTTGIVPFSVVDAHLLIPRGTRATIGLEDFLDVLAGGRDLPLRLPEQSGARDASDGVTADDPVGRTGAIPWRRFLAAVHGLGREIERERTYERGLQHALDSPVRLRGLRDHLEAARTADRLTDADLLYAFYEIARELARIRDAGQPTAGRALIDAAHAKVMERVVRLTALVPPQVADQVRILNVTDGAT